MKAKILLALVFINLVFIGIYLVASPSLVEAVSAKENVMVPHQQPQIQQQVSLNPSDQLEILRLKEERLKERESELKELEQQVQEKIKKLQAIETTIRNDLDAYKVVSGERIKHLIKIYSSMKPNAAATLMNNLDPDVAVEVFLGMKGDIAGGILSYMEPVKAAGITQKLVSYRGRK